MLVHCLYVSRPRIPLTEPHIDSILESSRKNNIALGITGVLCFTDTLFLQVLEGGRDEVCEVYNSIVRDERHHDVRLLVYGEIELRRFGSWSMGQVNLSMVNPGLILKYSERSAIDPYKSSGHSTFMLLDELVSSGAIIVRHSAQISSPPEK